MAGSRKSVPSALAPSLAAPQHKPRPLILFLDMLREQTAGNPVRMARALAGLRAYQEAERAPPPELMPVVAEQDGAMLRDYGGEGAPVLFVPSLINPPTILDLSPDRSLLRWLAGQGHRVLLLDWSGEGRADLSVAGHVTNLLVPLIGKLEQAPALVGYCLGGTMALAAAALAPVPRVATIAAPWRFAGFCDQAKANLARLWAGARPAAESLCALPMEVLQSAFWSLDPQRTVAKFEAFAATEPGSAQAGIFVTLEDWANDGPPIGLAAARELFEDFFASDLPGRCAWRVGGQAIEPEALACPALHVLSTSDRIVPAASAPPGGERIELALGHVGMVVGSRAREALWQPFDRWLSQGAPG